MNEVKLTVDVICNWLGYEPTYRIYVDGDLITERTYTWGSEEYVREHIIVVLDSGSHNIKLEKVKKPGTACDFYLKNFKVNGQDAALVNGAFIV